MTRAFPIAALLLLAACGKSNEDQLKEAANQSDPAAAAVLENSAENGADPQQALEQAGNAQLAGNDVAVDSTVQARPNLPGSPNRKDGTQPPDKVNVNGQ
ncbi:hypothetical protein G7077_11065 [Sphingomonas piscis]|uniref:Lipoprotein n=1 Tax=Sphingomonas piscis TaxID=2714943 RepID=A0A6G7YRK0_9SPHN|nr:hypothetical protein [Sphingomonas piscis]QIK79362.1 hypothetical protein G7077_11065 [Sphingomonas piscis]